MPSQQRIACFFAMFLSANAPATQDVIEIHSAHEAVAKSLLHSPDVGLAYQQFLISTHDVNIARGGYFPQLDGLIRSGYEYRNLNTNESYRLNRAELNLTQLLYDGARTRKNVRQFEQAQVVRLYEFFSEAQTIALDTALAYTDIAMFRELLALAEDNLLTHIDVFKQVEESVQAGVARGADLEQITGRLSLSESNVITEISNLHDVTARFIRLTGAIPGKDLSPIEFNDQPKLASISNTLTVAYTHNPTFLASLYNIDAQKLQLESEKGNYYPRLEFVAGYSAQDRDLQGEDNTLKEGNVALQLSYNFYRGGSDKATVKQAAERVMFAQEQRDKACVDMRQTIQIAFNDIEKIGQQLPPLNDHKMSSSRVKTAYMDQFNIGQRTLLDVLDSENEFFQASRAYIEAIYAQKKAQLRLMAETGQLLPYFDAHQNQWPNPSELSAEHMQYDPDSVCPAISASAATEPYSRVFNDDDNDGITNPWDECADTPEATTVDARGCPVESENPWSTRLHDTDVKDALVQIADTGNSDDASEVYKGLTNLPMHTLQRVDVNFARYHQTGTLKQSKVARALGAYLANNPDIGVIIHGHSSLRGKAHYNLALSMKRAESLADYLEDTFNVSNERITVFGHGEKQPLMNKQTKQANTLNRRIEIELVPANLMTTLALE
ncbi:TolC family outer membrane protein [Aestuariibacter sp. AA17]|uniref:TolC family outer membrane protein n=1 Tax=Fluctibacter corallii TaxID=2984329 RepID=A0ABT3A767_9ALTE|nr:TolC family outer membrane protein [Aestuariibacter sp. AA17]MCV2884532.1 TolC family outer membrane protein [Aestuariibacter sp. AA17]